MPVALSVALAALIALLAPGAAPAATVGHVRLALDKRVRFDGPSDFGYVQSAARNRYVILQSWQTDRLHALKFSDPSVKVLMYQAVGAVTSSFGPDGAPPAEQSPDAGVTYAEALGHPSWLLHLSSTRQPFSFTAFAGLHGANVGDEGYADAWARNVIFRLKSDPEWDGVFMDNVDTSMEFNTSDPSDISEYPTAEEYQGAVKRFLARVYPQFQAFGELTFANIGNWVDHRDAGISWLPYLSGAMDEKFVKWGRVAADDPGPPLRYAGYRDAAQWLSQLQEEQATTAAGKTFLAITTSGYGDEAAARYGYATTLLGAGGPGDAVLGLAGGPTGTQADDYTYDEWYPKLFELVLGAPASDVTQDADGLYRRVFTGGLVLVNPTANPIAGVDLGGQYSGPGVLDGSTSADLAPHSALVLTAGPAPVTTPEQFPVYVPPAPPLPPAASPPPPAAPLPIAPPRDGVKGAERSPVPLVRRTSGGLTLQAEALRLPPGARRFGDAHARGAFAVLLTRGGVATRRIGLTRLRTIAVRARADLCRGAPRLIVRVNGAVVLSRLVRSRSWLLARVRLRHRLTLRSVSVAYRGDYERSGCDRNLRIDTIALSRG